MRHVSSDSYGPDNHDFTVHEHHNWRIDHISAHKHPDGAIDHHSVFGVGDNDEHL